MPGARLSYEESCRRLQKDYLGEGVFPPMPNHLPGPNDGEPLGVSFFRTFVGEGDDLSNLTLPHTFCGRSEINDACFRNTDFTESNFRWNDFVDVDFSEAILSGSDMRASIFHRVRFDKADLRLADLRQSTFEKCSFQCARMEGTILTRKQGATILLSEDQRAEIAWADDDGDEPEEG